MPIAIHCAPVADIDPQILYRILWLRVSTFVVEQQAAYAELDGRDIEAGAELAWIEDSGQVVSTLRILPEPTEMRIGRVATSPAARGRGHSARLMRLAIGRCAELRPGAPIVLDAQTHLGEWYGRFGFTQAGESFIEDDIPHIPMRLAEISD
ncbi:GNAT family N-acetyltransferase [Microbacterium sp. NPDC076911]|uniref:GNAT family N-acetyltransferase n=1 Tax=Microbacterium sp. NPDC076911 TaxID=3154958 RepID=UPI00342F9FAE